MGWLYDEILQPLDEYFIIHPEGDAAPIVPIGAPLIVWSLRYFLENIRGVEY